MKLLRAATLAILFALILVPVVAVFSQTRGSGDLRGIFSTAEVTVVQALMSTLIAGFLGLVLGLFLTPSGKWIEGFLAFPFAVPTVVAGVAWTSWLGRHGILSGFGIHLSWLYSMKAVVFAHVFYNVPWVALLVIQARARISEKELEVSRTLGASWRDEMRWVVWPKIRASYASALAQVFSLCVMSFALVLILGGGPPVETLETSLYSRIRVGELDISGAALCGVLEFAITLVPWILILFLNSKTSDMKMIRPSKKRSINGIEIFIAAFFFLPYFVVFSGGVFRLWMEKDFWSSISSPAIASVEIAFFAAILAVGFCFLGLLSGKNRKWIPIALSFPSGISILILGLGFFIAYGKWIDPFSGSLFAIVVLQGLIFVPSALRILWPVSIEKDQRAEETARSLGASPSRIFRDIEWPRWKKPIVTATALVAAASLGEVAAVSLFYSEKWIPLPLLISREMAQYHFEQAQAISALLLALSAITIFGVNLRLSRS